MQDSHKKIVLALFPQGQLIDSRRLTGGVSADVFLLQVQLPNETKQVVLRIHGDNHGGHPARLEFELLSALHKLGLPVPKPLHCDSKCVLIDHPYLLISFVEGSTSTQDPEYVNKMAKTLAMIHEADPTDLPKLPIRTEPMPELFDYLPEGSNWDGLRDFLQGFVLPAYNAKLKLLHGDFWPENLMWHDGELTGILDWEDAAVGDPLSDVASCRVELRYKFGADVMQKFTDRYIEAVGDIDLVRLHVWQIYVSAAAQKYMGQWGLPAEREAHMRKEALASIDEAGRWLITQLNGVIDGKVR